MLIIVPNLLNVVFKNSSVIELLPPTNIVMPLRGASGVVGCSGELGTGELVVVVGFEVEEETKLLYKFCEQKGYIGMSRYCNSYELWQRYVPKTLWLTL